MLNLKVNTPAPFAVGDAVGHSDDVIRRARDYFLSCGREPMRSGAEADLQKKQAARGTVTACLPGTHTPWVVEVTWEDGSKSSCLPYRVRKMPLTKGGAK